MTTLTLAAVTAGLAIGATVVIPKVVGPNYLVTVWMVWTLCVSEILLSCKQIAREFPRGRSQILSVAFGQRTGGIVTVSLR
jgi:hypothetical protein